MEDPIAEFAHVHGVFLFKNAVGFRHHFHGMDKSICDERRNTRNQKRQKYGFVVIDTAAFDEFQRGCTGRLYQFFDGVEKSFIGVHQDILHFILDVFAVDALVFFLAAVATEIGHNFVLAVSTGFVHG